MIRRSLEVMEIYWKEWYDASKASLRLLNRLEVMESWNHKAAGRGRVIGRKKSDGTDGIRWNRKQ